MPVTSELSELGRGLAALVDTVPVQAAEHLLRLVRHSLAAPPPGLLREARLGLLIDLLGARNGELVGTDVYETARAERLLRGENWPVYTTVLRAFGDWLHAQMAAIRLAYLGTQARAPRSMRHTGGRARYTKREVIEVFIELRRVFGVWMTSGEYLEFADLRRRAARRLGHPEPRLPTMAPLTLLFGGYAGAVSEARAAFGEAGTRALEFVDVAGASDESNAEQRLHPVAAGWWRLVRGLNEADRRFLFRCLTRRLRRKHTLIAELMLSAIDRCRQDLGTESVSCQRYRWWRADQERPDEWPSAGAIRRYYVRWSAALDDLGITPTPDILVRRLVGRNGAFTAEEILAGVDVCAGEWRQSHPGVPLRFWDYFRWAQSELGCDRPRFHRLAIAPATLNKHFGSWVATLQASGNTDLVGFVFGQRRSLSDEEILDRICQAAAETSLGGNLTTAVYDNWAQDTENAERIYDATVVIARHEAVGKRFENWPTALFAAGLISETEHARRHAGGVHGHTRDDLLTDLADALDALGDRATRAEYGTWREQSHSRLRIRASGSWLAQELGDGSWRRAKAAAMTFCDARTQRRSPDLGA